LVLSRFAFWVHRATRASTIFAGGDAHCVVKPSPVQGVLGTSYAVGVKLRRVGPIAFASAAYCIVKPRGEAFAVYCIVKPRGEAFAVAGHRDAGVLWAEGLHSGWKARMTGWASRWGPQKLRPVPLMKFSCCCLPSMRLPFLGGEGEQWGLLLPTCG
jgi:hypothetical protein